MRHFSTLTHSLQKSKQLRDLQQIISPPEEMDDTPAVDVVSSHGKRKINNAMLEDFLDLCESDPVFVKIQADYSLSRDELIGIHTQLMDAGLGQWINGHHAALSSIAYPEPLLYILESERRGTPRSEIAFVLLQYWGGDIAQDELLEQLSS